MAGKYFPKTGTRPAQPKLGPCSAGPARLARCCDQNKKSNTNYQNSNLPENISEDAAEIKIFQGDNQEFKPQYSWDSVVQASLASVPKVGCQGAERD